MVKIVIRDCFQSNKLLRELWMPDRLLEHLRKLIFTECVGKTDEILNSSVERSCIPDRKSPNLVQFNPILMKNFKF